MQSLLALLVGSLKTQRHLWVCVCTCLVCMCMCMHMRACVFVCQQASVSKWGFWHLPVPVERQQLSPTAHLRDVSWVTVTSWSLESSPQSTGFALCFVAPNSIRVFYRSHWSELILQEDGLFHLLAFKTRERKGEKKGKKGKRKKIQNLLCCCFWMEKHHSNSTATEQAVTIDP